MSTNIGLYYPYLHFPNDEWVKLSALYWDKMYRIVPKHHSGMFGLLESPIVQQFHNYKFIGTVQPESHDQALRDIKTQFLRLLVKHEKELVKFYSIDLIDSWSFIERPKLFSEVGQDHRLEYIFHLKMDYELVGMLKKTKLATADRDLWVGMHPKLASAYMAALAETLAKQIQASPVTDEEINYFALSGFTFERLAQVLLDVNIVARKPTWGELEALLAEIAVRTVIPKNIDSVPVEQIMAIREKYSGQLGKFHEYLHSIIVELPKLKEIEAQEFVNDHLEVEFKKKIKPNLDELDDAMNSLGIETMPSILNMEVKIPTTLTKSGILAGATLASPILGGTAAIAMGLLKIIGDKRKAIKKVIKESDVSYLLHIREDLTPIRSLEWLNLQARKALFGI